MVESQSQAQSSNPETKISRSWALLVFAVLAFPNNAMQCAPVPGAGAAPLNPFSGGTTFAANPLASPTRATSPFVPPTKTKPKTNLGDNLPPPSPAILHGERDLTDAERNKSHEQQLGLIDTALREERDKGDGADAARIQALEDYQAKLLGFDEED